eukprot:TRINITY_DN8306_c0_g1_i1.p1 TRINITY_DN8306_c0_g1~~TRINITY_DN8306_c0_g1_i1.p1  ORF type:complete len:212 (+),score=49.46 TRINITY_DN8306_c0_g1_i1:252-887(+)
MGVVGSRVSGCQCHVEDFSEDDMPLLPTSVMVRNLFPLLEPADILCSVRRVCRGWCTLVQKSHRMWLSGPFISRLSCHADRDFVLRWSAEAAPALLRDGDQAVGCSEDLTCKPLTRKGVGTHMTCDRIRSWLAARATIQTDPLLRAWIDLVDSEAPANIDLWAATSHWSDGYAVATDRLVELRMDTNVLCSFRLFCCTTWRERRNPGACVP